MAKKQTSRPEKPVPQKGTKQKSTSNLPLWLTAISIAAFTFLCLSPLLQNSFTNWDDNGYVFENKILNVPLGNAIVYFFHLHYFIGNYHPLTMLVYILEYKHAGLDASFFHLVNLVIHTVNVTLVFWLTWLLSNRKLFVAAFVALFFGIHPMHLESVAWIAELKDMLYGCFFLSGLIVYSVYNKNLPGAAGTRNRGWKYLIAVFILFVLSVLSKPAAVTFPVVLLLVNYYMDRKINGQLWLEKIPFFIVSAVFGIIAIKAQASDHLLHDYYPFHQRLLFACGSFLLYILKLLVPYKLSIFHPYPLTDNGHILAVYYVAPILVAALCYFVYRTLKYTRLVAFGFAFFLVNLLLVLQLISVGDAVMAERYTYVPYIGLLFMTGMYTAKLFEQKSERFKNYKIAAATVLLFGVALFSYTSYARCAVWQNDDTLATDLVEKYPNDKLALNNRGFVDYNIGNKQEAIEYYKKALTKSPDYTMASINLVNAYLSFNDYDDAEKYVNQALSYKPQNYDLLTTKGYMKMMEKQYPEAMALAREALSIKKSNINSYLVLGQCYYSLQQYDSSIATLCAAMDYDTTNIYVLNNLGYSLYTERRYSEAIPYLKKALAIAPEFKTAEANLSNCYRAMSDSAHSLK